MTAFVGNGISSTAPRLRHVAQRLLRLAGWNSDDQNRTRAVPTRHGSRAQFRSAFRASGIRRDATHRRRGDSLLVGRWKSQCLRRRRTSGGNSGGNSGGCLSRGSHNRFYAPMGGFVFFPSNEGGRGLWSCTNVKLLGASSGLARARGVWKSAVSLIGGRRSNSGARMRQCPLGVGFAGRQLASQ